MLAAPESFSPKSGGRKSILSFGRRGNQTNTDTSTMQQQQQQQQQPSFEQKPIITLADLAAPVKGPQVFISTPEMTITSGNGADVGVNMGGTMPSDAYTAMPSVATEQQGDKTVPRRRSVRQIFRRKKSEAVTINAAAPSCTGAATAVAPVDNKPAITLADLAAPYNGEQSFVPIGGENERQRSPLSIDAPVMIDYKATDGRGQMPLQGQQVVGQYSADAAAAGDDRSSDGGRSVNTVVSATRSLVRTLSKIRIRGNSHAGDEVRADADSSLSITPQPPSTPPPSNSVSLHAYDSGNMEGGATDTSPRKKSVLRSLLPKRRSDPSAVSEAAGYGASTAAPVRTEPPKSMITLADLARPYSAQRDESSAALTAPVGANNGLLSAVPPSHFNNADANTAFSTAPTFDMVAAPAGGDAPVAEEGKKWPRLLRAPSILKRNTDAAASASDGAFGDLSSHGADASAPAGADGGGDSSHQKWALFHRSQHSWFRKDKPSATAAAATGDASTDAHSSTGSQPIITLADLASPYKGPQQFVSAPDATSTTIAAGAGFDAGSSEAPVHNSSRVTFDPIPSVATIDAGSTGVLDQGKSVTTASESNKVNSEFLSPTARTRWSLNAAPSPGGLSTISEIPADAGSLDKSPSGQRKSIFRRAFGGKSVDEEPAAAGSESGASSHAAANMSLSDFINNSDTETAAPAVQGDADAATGVDANAETSGMAPMHGLRTISGDENNMESLSNTSKGSLIRTLSMVNPIYRRKMRLEEEREEEERIRAEDAARYSEMRETVTTLAAQLDKLRSNLTMKLEEKDAKIDELTRKNSNLRSESEALQSQYQQLAMQCQQIQQQYMMLQQNYAQQTQLLSGEKQTAQQMLQPLQSEVASSRSARDELEQRIRTLQAQSDDANNKLRAMDALLSEKETIIDQLQGTGRQLEVEFRQLDTQKKDLTNALSEEQRKNSELKDRAYNCQTEMKQLKATNENMLMEYNNMRQQYFQLQQQAMQRVQYAEQQYHQLESNAAQQQQQLSQQVQAAEQSKQKLEAELRNMKAAGVSSAADVAAMQSKLQQLEAQLASSSAELQQSTAERAAIESKLAEESDKLSKKDLECLQLSSQLKKLSTDSAYFEKETGRLKKEIQSVHKPEAATALQAKAEAEAKLKDVNSQLLKAQEQMKHQWDYAQQQYKMLEEKLVQQQAEHQKEVELLKSQQQNSDV